MFSAFFYLLREKGLDVSLNEWLTLIQALDQGLAHGSFTAFYYLARCILVKSETEYDTFDGAFLEFFQDIKEFDELPQELIDWLNHPKEHPDNYDAAQDKYNLSLSMQEIQKMLLERLQEQDSEHNGGKYWIGTGGMSVFGNAGNASNGIRVGGESIRKSAMQVASERKFHDFRSDQVLNTRQFQMAFRRLRQFSSRVDAPKTELDIEGTIEETGNQGGNLKLVYQKPRQNTVKVLLLMDSGGSMDYYSFLCTTLFQAVSKSNHFKDLKVYYFHNCIYSKLYTDPYCIPGQWIDTQWVLDNLNSEYKVIIVGDASMDPSELLGRSYYSYGARTDVTGMEWLKRFQARYPHMVWLNPIDNLQWRSDFWRQTYDIIDKEFDMYPLTVNHLEEALKKLISNK
ncbi:MAG TPA: VWA domain-containing protein [Firmicutes bacterium]|nr:VWA domain-containing protein [Bacillota bacterium]